MTTSVDTNCSNDNLTTEDINIRLRLYDGTGIADWFIDNVVSESISTEDETEIKNNFPRANYIQWIVDRVAYSMPPFEVVFSPKVEKFKSKAEPTGDEAADSKALSKEEEEFNSATQKANDARREKIEKHIREIQERQCWEGEKDFWASVPIWRAFLLVCGDTFVKLPWADDLKGVAPERMGPQWTMIQLSGKRKKHIGGYRFMYPIGSTGYQNDPSGQNFRTEIITEKAWTITEGKKTGTQTEIKSDTLSLGWIPVSHMAFKEREDHPRGMPFINAIMEKALHLYGIQLTRRLGNKYNAAPIIVRINAAGSPANMRPGENHNINDKSPLHKADVKAVGGGLSLTSTEAEYQDALKELEDAAFLPHEGREQSSVMGQMSGSATEQLSKSQVAFREAFTRLEGSFYGDLFFKTLVLEGEKVERSEITCQYDSVQQPTAQEKQNRADALFTQSFMRQALTEMGYEEDQIDAMLLERDEEKEKQSKQFMADALGDEEEKDEDGNPIKKEEQPIPAK